MIKFIDLYFKSKDIDIKQQGIEIEKEQKWKETQE